ncbi:MAG: hypothetical protein RIQ60_3582 [Pseudomonadota bacterium]|jgi:multisubunit Na+/H+ antiporter MnhE subunit
MNRTLWALSWLLGLLWVLLDQVWAGALLLGLLFGVPVLGVLAALLLGCITPREPGGQAQHQAGPARSVTPPLA